MSAMSTPFLPYPVGLFMEDSYAEDGCSGCKFINLPKYFDPNLLFFGAGDEPLKLCQRLLETVVNCSSFMTVRPSISVLSMIPSFMEELPETMSGLQVVAFGKKYNWKERDAIEGAFYVTNYDSIRLDGLRKKKEIPVEDFLECRNVPRNRLYGVIFQPKEPTWLSRIRSAEIFNFKKRLADVLHISSDKVFWLQTDKELTHLLSVTMHNVYRCREDKESEENENIVRGKVQRTTEEKQKELLEPTTMLYGELAEKNGLVLAEGV